MCEGDPSSCPRPPAPTSPRSPPQAHITGGTKLPLSILDLRSEFLQQRLLDSPDGWGLAAGLQGQLRRGTARPQGQPPCRPFQTQFLTPSSLHTPLEKRHRHQRGPMKTQLMGIFGFLMLSALGLQLESCPAFFLQLTQHRASLTCHGVPSQ